MKLLDRIPSWSTTGIGSLPFDEPGQAVDQAIRAYDIPFCPQLPLLGGDMISEWIDPEDSLATWPPDHQRGLPVSWAAFTERVLRHPPDHRVVKLQVTGPVTLTCGLNHRTGEETSSDLIAGLAMRASAWLASNLADQVEFFDDHGLDVVLVVDEPLLDSVAEIVTPQVWGPLREIVPAWGLHLCCPVPWDLVELAEPDLLSFDLALEELGDRAVEVLSGFRDESRKVAWGVVDGHRPSNDATAISRLHRVTSQVPGIDRHSLLTPTCGTGLLAQSREVEVARELRKLRNSMRSRSAASD